MQKLKILALNGLAWTWGLLCLLVGMVDFFQGEFILGALVIVGALLILPPFRKKIPLKPKNITIVAILMTFVPLAILGNKKAIEQQAQKPQETKQEPIQTNNNETENQTIQTPPKPETKKQEQEVVKKSEPKRQEKPKEKDDNSNVQSHSQVMDFNNCLSLQRQTAEFLQGQTVLHLVNTSELSLVKYCTVDGVILITCSKPDGKMVTTKSDNMKGCK